MEQNHQSLYRVYRPKSFQDVAGHKNIVEILQTQLRKQTFSHAFLFSGQRGTGKTSVARILAKAVNCLNLIDGNPCNQCSNCQAFNDNKFSDVYEIDAASNNGVDEIRNIKANVSTLPIIGKYKVYIIDEVHMLTKGAFNALLKTLEEPPMHVIFILATTEYDKIPQTIISRCQAFNFKKLSAVDLEQRLKEICSSEGYKLESEVNEQIYQLSDGSLRDALNVLEQLMILSDNRQLNLTQLKKIFYVMTKSEKLNLLSLIFNQEVEQVIVYFEQAKNQGLDFDVFSLSLMKILKEIIEYKLTKNPHLINEINQSDAMRFEQVKLVDLFSLTDGLTQAYGQTKTRTISYDAIILSLIQSIQNFSQPYHLKVEPAQIDSTNLVTEMASSDNESKPEVEAPLLKETNTVQWTQDIINDLVKADNLEVQNQEINLTTEKNETEKIEPTLIDNFINESKPINVVEQDSELATNLLGLIRKQNELIMEQTNLDQPIEFLIEDLINVLRGAAVDKTIMLRKELGEKINHLFITNDQSNLLTPIQANQFIAFYNSKIVVANKHELIVTVDDQMGANLINHWLLKQANRDALFALLGNEFVIYAVSEQLWSETKSTHMRLKERHMLPNYEQVNLQTFYGHNQAKTTHSLSEESQDVFDKVANLFGDSEIKIG